VFTTAMTAADLDQLDGLDLCPMIFQEQIDNQLDVRVTIVGKHVFAAAIDAAARGGGDPDWRRDSYAHDRAPVWSRHELPRALGDRLGQLLDQFGLNFGAIDLLVRIPRRRFHPADRRRHRRRPGRSRRAARSPPCMTSCSR
jgi:hypothetical protein